MEAPQLVASTTTNTYDDPPTSQQQAPHTQPQHDQGGGDGGGGYYNGPNDGGPPGNNQERGNSQSWIQVALDKPATFYAKLGRRMLSGNGNEVVVTGLGSATNVAIGTASIMEREAIATIAKVETTYYTSSRARRRLPKITVTLRRAAGALLEEDQPPVPVAA